MSKRTEVLYARVSSDVAEELHVLAAVEERSLSKMIAILVDEALTARRQSNLEQRVNRAVESGLVDELLRLEDE